MQSDTQWNERIERISKNVFFGVYKRNLPDGFIREANTLVIDQKFVRSSLYFTYTIADANYKSRDDIPIDMPFVKLSAVARYKIKNVSDSPAKYMVGVGLPNPSIEEMKAVCKVNKIAIRGGGPGRDPFPLEDADRKFRLDLKDDSNYQVTFRVGEVELQPNEEIEVVTDYVMAKEEEDTEVVQTLYPTESVSFTVMDQGPTKRAVRARALHVGSLEDNTSADSVGVYNFRLDRFFLPHQGFVLWWKKKPLKPPPPETVN